MKKFLSILLATMMVLAMVGTAFAETVTTPTYKITLPAKTGTVDHNYEVYQIFTGTLDADSNLTEIVWGQNGTGTDGANVPSETLSALTAVNSKTDEEKLAVIASLVNLDSTPIKTGISGAEITGLEAGYYLVKEAKNDLTNENEAYTTYIVKVCLDVAMTAKSAQPSVDKQVWDDASNDQSGATDGWFESADHNLNETFQFKLIATLPADSDYAAYETYKIVFNDTMSAGVTFEQIASVKVGDTVIPAKSDDAPDGYVLSEITTEDKGVQKWSLTVNDLKKYVDDLTAGATVTVVYDAHLNNNACITETTGTTTDNKNTVDLQFSNNPNVGGEGELGRTPEDHVWVFTYVVNNTKFQNAAAAGNEMAGAGFTLYTGNSTSAENAVKLYQVSNGVYQVVNANTVLPEGAEIVTEMFSATDDDTTEDNETGMFNIKGLDAGTYTLVETTVPTNYNKCADITIVINATHSENGEGTAALVDFNSNQNVDNDVINKTGATLPETGGIGTTLFYLFGGIMAAGSALILIVRRRADAEEE